MRTVLVTFCLGIAALLLWKLTTVHDPQPLNDLTANQVAPGEVRQKVPFSLTLSAPATEIALRDPQGTVLYEAKFATPQNEISDRLSVLPEIIHLTVQWHNSETPQNYFAKLQLDIPGKDTLTHVFDGTTHLDDIWELP
jgi:hypothetical protein